MLLNNKKDASFSHYESLICLVSIALETYYRITFHLFSPSVSPFFVLNINKHDPPPQNHLFFCKLLNLTSVRREAVPMGSAAGELFCLFVFCLLFCFFGLGHVNEALVSPRLPVTGTSSC